MDETIKRSRNYFVCYARVRHYFFFLLLVRSPPISMGFTISGGRFAYVAVFFSHIPSSDGACWVAAFTRLGYECQDLLSPCDGMHVCTDWTSTHTLIRRSFGGNGVRNHVNSKGKIPSTRKILLRGGSNPRRCITDSEPNTLPTKLYRPRVRH